VKLLDVIICEMSSNRVDFTFHFNLQMIIWNKIQLKWIFYRMIKWPIVNYITVDLFEYLSFSWTRDQAIEYMSNYTASGDSEISFEVNRYISLPGQACAYKIGELKLWELRNKSSKELGKANVRTCLIRCCSCRKTVTRLMSLVGQELLSFQNIWCTSGLSGVRAALCHVLSFIVRLFFLLVIVLSVIRITASSCKNSS
jgi:hypothetical protein